MFLLLPPVASSIKSLPLSSGCHLPTRDGTTVFKSTPKKAEYSDKNNYKNEYHLKEFYIEEFREFLQEHFASVYFIGQRLISTSLFWSMDNNSDGLDVAFEDAAKSQELRLLFTPVYVIAQCSKSDLFQIKGSVFITSDDSLSEEHLNSVPIKTVNEILASMDEERRVARNQLDTYEAELIVRANALAAADDRIRHLVAEFPDKL